MNFRWILDKIQMKFRGIIQTKFRQNLDKFRTRLRLTHVETIQTNLEKKIQTYLEEFRTDQNLEKFRQFFDKFRTPQFTDGTAARLQLPVILPGPSPNPLPYCRSPYPSLLPVFSLASRASHTPLPRFTRLALHAQRFTPNASQLC